MKVYYIIVLLLTSFTFCFGQDAVPGLSPWTPVVSGNLERVAIEVPAKYQAIALSPVTNAIEIPKGWTAKVFFAGAPLNKGRFLAWGPDSVLFVANMTGGNILAMPDKNRDGVADTVIIAATGFATGHDVRFWHDTMYVSQLAGVVKLWRSSGTGYVYDQRRTLIDKSTLSYQTGGHVTRTLVIDTVHARLFVNVGSRANAEREMTAGRERALIEVYDMDGTNRRIYATGIRNSVGMTLHPRTGRLWANNNGSDNQGNDVPGEWIDLVRDGGFYGHPLSYAYRQFFNFTRQGYTSIPPITSADTALVNSTVPPAALITSHSAPMAMQFSHDGLPEEFRHGAFVVLRGSWNRQPATGSKVVFLTFDDDNDTVANTVQDFCRGFLPDSNNSASRWARPVGLEIDASGCIYLTSDDNKQFVLKLTPPSVANTLTFDTLSPILSVIEECGDYHYTATELRNDPIVPTNPPHDSDQVETGISTVEFDASVPATNYRIVLITDQTFPRVPSYKTFAFRVEVIDRSRDAFAIIRVSDFGTNSFDGHNNYALDTLRYTAELLAVDPPVLSFGKRRVGSRYLLDFVLMNNDPNSIAVNALRLSNNSLFKLTSEPTLPRVIASGTSISYTLEYNASHDSTTSPVGRDRDTLIITTRCGEFRLPAIGFAVEPRIKVADFDAGSTGPNELHCGTLRIENDGSDTLTINDIQGYQGSNFSLSNPYEPVLPFKVSPRADTGNGNFINGFVLLERVCYQSVDAASESIDVTFNSNAVSGDSSSNWKANAPVSVERIDPSIQIAVTPRPANDVLHVLLPELMARPVHLTLVDITGSVVGAWTVSVSDPSSINLEFSALSSGTYTLIVSTTLTSYVVPVIIAR